MNHRGLEELDGGLIVGFQCAVESRTAGEVAQLGVRPAAQQGGNGGRPTQRGSYNQRRCAGIVIPGIERGAMIDQHADDRGVAAERGVMKWSCTHTVPRVHPSTPVEQKADHLELAF